LWLVTSDAQKVLDADACDTPDAASLWGLGRALSAEHAELWGGLVDLASTLSPEDAARQLVCEVEHGGAEDKLALREAGRFVPRLQRRPQSAQVRPDFSARAEATYLVTGGLGGIGLAMAHWLAERGARHLLLLGRTPMPPRAQWAGAAADSAAGRRIAAVQAIEALGAVVDTAAIDIAADGALEACLAVRAARGAPAVAGVIHAAGVLQFQALESQDAASLHAGLAAKMGGAWRLHRLFETQALDCFVMFSSSSALLNSPLLGGYAAGNAALDALAHHRRARGLAALSVNWGTWGEVGMAVESGRSASGDMLSGVGTIGTARGLAALGELLRAGDAQAALMPIDWVELAHTYPAFAEDPFLAELVGAARREPVRPVAPGLTFASLQAAAAQDRAGLVAAYLRTEASRVLGLGVDRLDPTVPLGSLGFDSLMAVQLKNRIETDLRVAVPMIQFLQGPSVDELSPALLTAVESVAAQSETMTNRVEADAWEEGSL
jgi:NAD(P)-dependent dehydrogenase (short-subunit alcohol dehydrogenase family)/acyl carrier protein